MNTIENDHGAVDEYFGNDADCCYLCGFGKVIDDGLCYKCCMEFPTQLMMKKKKHRNRRKLKQREDNIGGYEQT